MTVTIHSKKHRSVVEKDGTIRVTVPISITRKGGRKYILAPQGESSPFAPVKINDAMVRALAKAFQIKDEIESGKVESFREIARRDDQSHSYLLRVFRLTMLAPDIVQAILDGRQPKMLELQELLEPLSLHWPEQRRKFGFPEIPATKTN